MNLCGGENKYVKYFLYFWRYVDKGEDYTSQSLFDWNNLHLYN